MQINIIVAVAQDGAIGKKGSLIWHLPEDLKRFKRLTSGHTVIMGRNTWESLPKKPLPGRTNIVISRNPDFVAEGAKLASSPEQALQMAADEDEVFIIGGEKIYKTFLPIAHRIYLTLIESECKEADAWFEFDPNSWHQSQKESVSETAEGIKYSYITYDAIREKD